MSCQQVIKNNLMKFMRTLPSNDFFLAFDCVLLAVRLIKSKSRKCNSAMLHYSSTTSLDWLEFSIEHANGTPVGVNTASHVYRISLLAKLFAFLQALLYTAMYLLLYIYVIIYII